MEIYRVKFEGFRHDYTGYWSSTEEILNNLPKCLKFQRVVHENTPRFNINGNIHLNPDYEYNRNLSIKLEITDHIINISIPEFRIQQTKVEDISEVKEAGKPYEPAKQIKTKLPDLYINSVFCKAYINVITVNELQND